MKFIIKHIYSICNYVVVFTVLFSVSSCLTEEEELEIKYKPVTIETTYPSSITYNSIIVGGSISAPQDRNVQRGVCWSTTQNPDFENDNVANSGVGIGAYSVTITGMNANTTYYIRAFAKSTLSTVYGDQVSVKTAMPTFATVSTNIITSITSTSVICGGNVTNDGGSTVISRGVCWSTTSNPTITNSRTSNGTNIGAFSSMITGLSAVGTYYVRAYATNSKGTAYGNEVSFRTLSGIPELSTLFATSISATSAISGGTIANDGGATITSRGICWSTLSSPTILNSKTIDGIGPGTFSSNLTGLSANTTYYVRSYATNSNGIAYGSQISFITQPISLPTLITSSASSITTSGAMSGGNISNDGGASVTSRGVCWSSNSLSPTTSNSRTIDGSGVGTFTSSITALTPGTIYYVRAYATNSAGTAYGSVINFRVLSISLPILSTNSISSITTSMASSGGNITSDGGGSVTSRGVCWSSSTSSPTISNSLTSNGSGTGSFLSSITGLSANTTYYVRAYATNSVGTSYGSVVSFSTNAISLPTISTSTIYSITTSSATGGGNITNDGGASVTSRGICWSSSTSSPTIYNSATSSGSGTGSFSSSLTGLSVNTTYYVRAYATNSVGTSYGSVVSFSTNAASLPTISTYSISSITTSSASCGGNVTSDGGGSVTYRGVCWSSTTSSPSLSSSYTSDGSGVGSFSSSLSSLSSNTTYYVRAYATNSAGTAYGNVYSFNTSAIAIGQSYQGGIIFYVDGTGLHGLVCATSDQSSGLRWHNGSYITTGATTSTVGYGNSNTNTIVSYQGSGSYAARLCYDLSLNGYSDWYLPTRSELSLMYTNLKLSNLGNFTNNGYWSSSEYSSIYSYYVSFSSGSYSTSPKSTTYYVRAIRAF